MISYSHTVSSHDFSSLIPMILFSFSWSLWMVSQVTSWCVLDNEVSSVPVSYHTMTSNQESSIEYHTSLNTDLRRLFHQPGPRSDPNAFALIIMTCHPSILFPSTDHTPSSLYLLQCWSSLWQWSSWWYPHNIMNLWHEMGIQLPSHPVTQSLSHPITLDFSSVVTSLPLI